MTSANSKSEEYFRSFWLGIEEGFKKETKSKLEQEILELKKKELWRKYISIIVMVPFAVSMAITLEAICSNWVLLGLISSALSHTVMPFEALSLICALYLIYNNRKIKKKEQELIDIESEKVETSNTVYDNDDYLHCIEVVTTTLCILGGIVSEALSQGIIEDVTFLFSNLVGFCISCTFYYNEYNKSKEQDSNTNEKPGSNITAAKLMLAGSSMLLIRRIMLVALASSLSATTIGSAIGPAIGLVGMVCFMVGYALTICSYSSKLQNLKVSGKGAAVGAASNIIGSKITSYNNCEVEGMGI